MFLSARERDTALTHFCVIAIRKTLNSTVKGCDTGSPAYTFFYRILSGIPDGKKINLSVRSESFVPRPADAPDTLPCVCTGVYTMGKDETASFTVGGTPFHAYIDQEEGLVKGQTIHLGFKNRGVFVFDRESGVRLK